MAMLNNQMVIVRQLPFQLLSPRAMDFFQGSVPPPNMTASWRPSGKRRDADATRYGRDGPLSLMYWVEMVIFHCSISRSHIFYWWMFYWYLLTIPRYIMETSWKSNVEAVEEILIRVEWEGKQRWQTGKSTFSRDTVDTGIFLCNLYRVPERLKQWSVGFQVGGKSWIPGILLA